MAQSQSAHASGRSATGKTTVQKAASLVGIVFLAVGVLGFVPGITTNYGSMQFASHDSAAKLLGLFQVSILHNIVHLLLFIYGLAVPMNSGANFVPVNGADNVLHLLLGLGMIALGALLPPRPDVAPRTNVAQS